MNNFKDLFSFLSILFFAADPLAAQQTNNDIRIVGAMKNVMWKGELYGNISLDTISNKKHLYGLGPVEYLTGEIIILNGKSYKSTVVTDTSMKVEETYNIKAPFFGYTYIEKWTSQPLPDFIRTIPQLEHYLDLITQSSPRPFMFRLTGRVEEATIHIVNLPPGSKVSSPEEAHQGQKNYQVKHEQSDILGFFSTTHQTVFTHHDTWLHMHLITADKKKMGHLDDVLFPAGGMILYLPAE